MRNNGKLTQVATSVAAYQKRYIMKKSELNKLKAIRKQCGEYANKVCKYSDEIVKIGKNNSYYGNELKNAIEELNMAMVKLGNVECYLIDFIRTEQPDYMQTNYNL